MWWAWVSPTLCGSINSLTMSVPVTHWCQYMKCNMCTTTNNQSSTSSGQVPTPVFLAQAASVHGRLLGTIWYRAQEATHALNMRSLTLVWWFTSASLLRRRSTIWPLPSLHAIKSAVWPSCTCKGEQDESDVIQPNSLHSATSHYSMTRFSLQLRDKIWEWPGNEAKSTDQT